MNEFELLQQRFAESPDIVNGEIRNSLLACMEAAERTEDGLNPSVVLKIVDKVFALSQENARLAEANETAHTLAFTDGLTGLPNRRAFNKALERETGKADRYGSRLSLVMIDIDHFKNYNDTYGHPDGDKVLECLARIMEGEVRENDTPARYGGEEFVMLLPETDITGAMATAEKLRMAVVDKMRTDITCFCDRDKQESYRLHADITLSFGVAEYDPKAKQVTHVADGALYEAKRLGRNRVIGVMPDGSFGVVSKE